jgi:hypothetical protein
VTIRHAKNSAGKKGSWLTGSRSSETAVPGGRTPKKRCKRFKASRKHSPLGEMTTRQRMQGSFRELPSAFGSCIIKVKFFEISL